MMLCKLSLKNIKKSFKDYTIYFFTLVLGVAIFYVFNSIDKQTVMMDVTKQTSEIINLMTNLLSGVSVFVSFILGFLVIYASRFLIKRRNKEFGIYLTLGMSKRKISMILFFETLFIGIISLGIGLLVGVILSQFMSLLVANMFDANLTKFTFVFSESACMKTLLYFGLIYLLVMIFNTINISKCKLIDLLYASKKSEKVKLKNSLACTIIFILASCVLSFAYYLVTGGFEHLKSANQIYIPIGLGVVSTFFIFWSLSGLLLKLFMNMKKVYYKGLNSFTLRQFSSKINTTVFSMTIICIMLFITICVLSSSLSIKNSMTANLDALAPVDVEFSKLIHIDTDNELIKDDSNIPILETLKKNGFDEEKLKDVTNFNVYKSDGLTLGKFLGSKLKKIENQYKFLKSDRLETIMTISDYNKIASLFGNKQYTLKDNEYLVIADFDSMVSLRNEVLNEKEPITINGKNYIPKYKECKEGFIDISSNHINDGILIVPDETVENMNIEYKGLVANYNTNKKEEKIVINEELGNIVENTWNKTSLTSMNSKLDIAEASIGLGALVTFIGLYLGIIFLISSAAILALKELSESSDNKMRFNILRRLGADEKLIHKTLFRQIAIFFMFPLFLAIIHSIFGIQFANFILETFGNDELLPSIIMTAIFIVMIYGGYFFITYFCSKNIIKER